MNIDVMTLKKDREYALQLLEPIAKNWTDRIRRRDIMRIYYYDKFELNITDMKYCVRGEAFGWEFDSKANNCSVCMDIAVRFSNLMLEDNKFNNSLETNKFYAEDYAINTDNIIEFCNHFNKVHKYD